VLGRRGPH